MRSLLIMAACAAAWLATPVLAQSRAADAILILDASGSMWGQVEGQTKIVAARKAVDTILARWKPGDRLGLMAYGHRAKGECRDIELVVPVGPVDAAAIKGAVQRLNPRGKTPIAASLREAAGLLKHTENKATVILVSDGIETCDPDPCAVAAGLKKAGIGFTAHVVGFDVTDPLAKAQLQCIARATGGVYLDARNAAGLDGAMTRVAQAAQGQKVASEAPAAAPRARDPFEGRNLRATARLAENSDPLTDPRLVWTLFRPDAEAKAGEHVQTEYAARLAIAAPAGDHILRVEYGSVTRDVPVMIDPGRPTTLDLVLDAGFATAEGRVPNGSLGDRGIVWEITSPAGDHVVTSYDPVPAFILPAGAYLLNLSKGYARTQRSFTLAAGDSINLPLDLPVGRLSVDAAYAASGPKVSQGLTVEIYQPAGEQEERGAFVATHYDPLSVFDLAAGPYEIVVGAGEARRSVKVEIASGRNERRTVTLDAGVVALTAPGASRIEIEEAQRSIEGARRHVHTAHETRLQTVLAAGDYIAIVFMDGEKHSETPITVIGGQRLERELK